MNQIFTPFYTTKVDKERHLGLGLGICFDIMAGEHGGSLELESEEGEGTTVTFTFPNRSKEKPKEGT